MDHRTAWRAAEGGARALRQDLTPTWESRFQHTDEHCRLELSHEYGDPDLTDPHILLLELAHCVLVDTGLYIDCPYRRWRVAQVPGRRSSCGVPQEQGEITPVRVGAFGRIGHRGASQAGRAALAQ